MFPKPYLTNDLTVFIHNGVCLVSDKATLCVLYISGLKEPESFSTSDKIGFSYIFSDFCILMKACEHGDLEILENYFHFGSQWHVLHYDPISEAIFAYNFEIADQLLHMAQT